MGTDPSQLKRQRPSLREWWVVAALQALFLITALIHLNGPLDSMHFVRQCQTFDIDRNVFRQGWSAVVTPRGSFTQFSSPYDTHSPLNLPAPRSTIIHLEVPFHGIFGWPAAQLFPHHPLVIVRLVSVVFALLSIALVFLVLRHWLEAGPALAGAALWTTVPVMIHCGQVPMPDILATAGFVLSFYLALRGSLAGSSAAFLFAILAKLNVIVYGLPILVALLIALNCRSLGQFMKIAVLWGLAPLVGIAGWISLGRHDPYGSWEIVGGFVPGSYGPPKLSDWLDIKFYYYLPIYLVIFGAGIMGVVGLLFALGRTPVRLNPLLKAAIILSLITTYVLEKLAWLEVQYSLPIIFWLVLAAGFGFAALQEKLRQNPSWRIWVAGLLIVHLAVAGVAVNYLESSRQHNEPSIEAAGRAIPPDSRVVVFADLLFVVPPVWLDRNTLTMGPFPTYTDEHLAYVKERLEFFEKAGYTHLMLFDVETPRRTKLIGSSVLGGPKVVYESDYTNPSYPYRKYFDEKYRKVFEGDHVVMYSLAP